VTNRLRRPRITFESENYRFFVRLPLREAFREGPGLDEAVRGLEQAFGFRITEIHWLHDDRRPHVVYRPPAGVTLPPDRDSMTEVSFVVGEDGGEWVDVLQADESIRWDEFLRQRVLPCFRRYLTTRCDEEIDRIPYCKARQGGEEPSGRRFRKWRKRSSYTLPHENARGSPIEARMAEGLTQAGISFVMQQPVFYEGRRFTVIDFFVERGKLAIYCDGYEYHYTKDCVIKDRQQDRMLQYLGYKVLRYTGSEIEGGLDRCVRGVQMFMEQARRRQDPDGRAGD